LAPEKLDRIAEDYDYSNTFLASVKTHTYWAESGVVGELSETNPKDKWFFETINLKPLSM